MSEANTKSSPLRRKDQETIGHVSGTLEIMHFSRMQFQELSTESTTSNRAFSYRVYEK
jgi:hypothetical protein